MIVALITLKYTQSNSVCYVKNGQAIGVGAGQQSRIHCTRLAGNKADNWYLRQHPKALGLQFLDTLRRPDRDNAIDVYLSDEYEDVLREGVWQTKFKVKPEPLTAQEKKEWIATQTGVTVGSDAFFPFGDNVERARKSGVSYIVEPGGSIRDDNVIETANRYHMVMAFTGIPTAVSEAMLGISTNRYVILFIINILLLIVGTFMDMTPACLIFTPIFLPICQALGMNTIHFGIMMIFNLCIGTITPPVGTTLFVGVKVGKTKIEQVIRPLLYYFGAIFIVLMLVSYIPQLSLWLPGLMGYV